MPDQYTRTVRSMSPADMHDPLKDPGADSLGPLVIIAPRRLLLSTAEFHPLHLSLELFESSFSTHLADSFELVFVQGVVGGSSRGPTSWYPDH